jgi:Flp pilus assembly protein TadB
MTLKAILGIFAILLALGSGLVVLIYFFQNRGQSNMRAMMGSYSSPQEMRTALRDSKGEKQEQVLEQLKAETKKSGKLKKKALTTEERLFQAGMVGPNDKAEFERWCKILPFIVGPVLFFGSNYLLGDIVMSLVILVLGTALGARLPHMSLDSKIKQRHEEIMFYLPLVIEQIAIGVSSSLDIGPCLQRVVSMADERDSHNVVTELLRYSMNYMKSGVGFEEAMVETGKAAGHTELKHALMFLAQVSKHGGEITRQLQELADSVNSQRQTHIEGKIKKLEVMATGPVTLVFAGFILILLSSFGVQLSNAF